jgi:hypothetical protein
MFDLAALYGFWSGVGDCFGRYFEYKGKQGAELMVRVLKRATEIESYKIKRKNKKKLRKSKSCTSSCSSKPSNTSSTFSSASASGNSATVSSGNGVARCKSAPAGVCGGGKAAAKPAAAPAAGVAVSATAALSGAAAAGAAAAAAAAAKGSSEVPGKVLIRAAANSPAVLATEVSTSENSECLSDSASFVSAHTDTAIFVADQGGPHSPAHIHGVENGGHMGAGLSSEISTC